MNIFEMARKDHRQIPRLIEAHKLSAEYHRHWNMVLGGLSTVLTTFVGTAIVTGLVSQLGLDGKGEIRIPLERQGIDYIYIMVIVLSISAPILAALHTFMHNAEDASAHTASVEGYANVKRRLTLFLAQYDNSDPAAEKKDEALKEYDEIMKEHNAVLGKSISLTKKAYEKADKNLKEKPKTLQQPKAGFWQAFFRRLFG